MQPVLLESLAYFCESFKELKFQAFVDLFINRKLWKLSNNEMKVNFYCISFKDCKIDDHPQRNGYFF